MSMTAFHEEQRLARSRFRWLVSVPPALLTALAAAQLWVGHRLGSRSLSNGGLIFLSMLLWFVYVRLTRVKLVTDVDRLAVSIRLRGLSRHHRIPIAKIKTGSVVRFNPNRDFGGYGIRSVPGGQAYVAEGDRGARLELEGGGFAVVGSRSPEQLLAAILAART
jgi:hypothetical protein